MRSLSAFPFIALFCFFPLAAPAQVVVPPTGSNYVLKFTSPPGTAEVCAFEVLAATGATTGVERNPPPGFDKADALACTKSVVADGTTANKLTLTLTPLPAADVLVALIGYAAVGDQRPQSAFSNVGQLLVAVRPSTLIP